MLDIVIGTGMNAGLLLDDLRSLGYRAMKVASSSDLDNREGIDICVMNRPNVAALNATLADLHTGGLTSGNIAVMVGRNDIENLDYKLVDEVIVLPYDLRELGLKLRLRNFQRENSGRSFATDGLILELDSREVTVDGRSLYLTFKEFELLKALMASPGRVLSRSHLVETIWHHDYVSGKRLVDVHVRRLRAKLGLRYSACIQTVRNVGYRFSPLSPG